MAAGPKIRPAAFDIESRVGRRKSPARRGALFGKRGGVRRGGQDLGEGFREPPGL
jgi:hypothetical protein